MSLLEVRGLEVRYGEIVAVSDLALKVEAGSFHALLGANGAGKSTTLQAIAGVVRPARGTITFDGERIDGRSGHEMARRGVVLIPEGRGIFPTLTVEDNLTVVLSALPGRGSDEERKGKVFDYFPVLADRRGQQAGTLSGGEQQMLALARAIVTEPKLLLLDEISLGLAPALVERLFEAVDNLHRQGVTIILVEQYVHEALRMADHAGVLVKGRLMFEGPSEALRNDEQLVTAYLGDVG